jgi:hypothetical protein
VFHQLDNMFLRRNLDINYSISLNLGELFHRNKEIGKILINDFLNEVAGWHIYFREAEMKSNKDIKAGILKGEKEYLELSIKNSSLHDVMLSDYTQALYRVNTELNEIVEWLKRFQEIIESDDERIIQNFVTRAAHIASEFSFINQFADEELLSQIRGSLKAIESIGQEAERFLRDRGRNYNQMK